MKIADEILRWIIDIGSGEGWNEGRQKRERYSPATLTVPIDCPPTPRVFLSSWDRGKKICDYTIVQDDTSRCPKPPVDFKTKVTFWPGQLRTGQSRAELFF